MSTRSLIPVADLARDTDPILGGKRRSAGLMLRASDVAWSAGPIILAITGRSAALNDLSGDGLDTLRLRM